MNKETEKTTEQEAEVSQENVQKEAPPKKRESTWNRAKKNTPAVALACGILFLVLYIIVNIQAFSDIFSTILSVLTPIILGGAIAYLLNPILKLFEFKVFKKLKRKKLIRGLSLLFTFIVAILIVVAFMLLLIPQLIDSIMDFASKMDSYIESTAAWINAFLVKVTKNESYSTFLDSRKIINFFKGLFANKDNIFNGVTAIGLGIFNSLKNILLAIFIAIYVLLSKERLKAQTHKFTSAVFSDKGSDRFYRYVTLCHENFSGFFVGKIIDSLIIGILTLILLLIFRIPYAPLVSAIICITNIVPVFGPFIGAIPSFLIIFIANPIKALIFLVLILLIQQLDGNVIGPKILGDSTGLSSLGVIISIIIMSAYFGIIGMIVGVPIFAVLVAIVKEFLEHKLEAKGLPTDTAEYYERNSLVNPRETRESLWVKIFKNLHPFSKKKQNNKKDNHKKK